MTIRKIALHVGGGVYNRETPTITGTTIGGNRAGSRYGGIYNARTLSINNSTLYGNSALCGNVLQHWSRSEGGGLSNVSLMVINNSIFYGNLAGEYWQNFVPHCGGIYNWESSTSTA